MEKAKIQRKEREKINKRKGRGKTARLRKKIKKTVKEKLDIKKKRNREEMELQ